jgi:hypothetical protein
MNVATFWRPISMRLVVCWSAFIGCALADPATEHANHEQPGNEFVLFLSAEAHHIDSPVPLAPLNEDAWFSADFVLALTRDRFRLFGEYLLSAEEHDLERFQVGYELAANTVVWLGRFHQPGSAWNTEHHHGRYLQTSVTRPAIERWEDENGVVPQHIAGVLFDSRFPIGDLGGMQVSLGSGLGPRIEEGQLEPLNLVDFHESGRHVSWIGRLAYLPDYAGASAFGIVLAHHRIPVIDNSIVNFPAANEVGQDIYGAFGEWHQDPWRLLAAVYRIRVDMRAPDAPSKDERFTFGYMQVERQLPRGLLAYGRLEDSSDAFKSTYLSGNYPDLELRRALLGLRWDVLPRHAVTLEVGRAETRRAYQSEYRLQWSAALP